VHFWSSEQCIFGAVIFMCNDFVAFCVFAVYLIYSHNLIYSHMNVQENNIPFMETSAKSGKNVKLVFIDVAK